ncbi:hypothetical protein GRF59_15045 [Paenibacillus sp. HJL G12]|uniref:Uncharacterized protein n=1 Tax=Paenibacillus dendrobii TaxID=2691084 RepID=A0A7X3IJ59_9BACL|nr:hypothetical protein [Paenibacillus dendrobii]MWV44937.1 hypothetical protein [Paenibacillus dendrobii]
MEWATEKLDIKNCSLEYLSNNNYKAQAEIVGKENIFNENHKFFGDFDLSVTVFNQFGAQIDSLELKGLNGSYQQAKNNLARFKRKIEEMYFQ